jgi:hypothetical protein
MAVKIRERKGVTTASEKPRRLAHRRLLKPEQSRLRARLTLGDLGMLEPKKVEKPEPTFEEYQKTWL